MISHKGHLQLIAVFVGVSLLNGSPEEEEPIFEVVFSAFGLNKIEDLFYVGMEDEEQPVQFFGNARSRNFYYEGTSPLVFYRKIPGEEDEAAVEREVVARVNLGPEDERLLLIFVSSMNGNGSKEYRVMSTDDSLSAFPFRSARFFNATKIRILGRINGKNIEMKFGPTGFYRPSGGIVKTDFISESNSGYSPVFMGELSVDDDERVYVFLLPPVLRGSLEAQYRIVRQTKDEFEEVVGRRDPESPDSDPE